MKIRVPVLFFVTTTLILLASCTSAGQSQMKTQIAQTGQTAIAEGSKYAATEAVQLQETAAAAVAKEATHLQETVVAAVATQLAGSATYQREFQNTANADQIMTGAYFYPWWGPDRDHWKGGYADTPSLGEYDSSQGAIVTKQIDWAAGHGVDFFAVSWWGPNSKEDSTFLHSLLTSELSTDMRFAVLYESTGRLTLSPDKMIDLDAPENRQRLLGEAEILVHPNSDLGAMVMNHLPRSGSRARRCSRSAMASWLSVTPLR